MKKIITIITVLIITAGSQGQTEKNKYYPYWYQKESLYRSLPNTADEIIFLGNSITDGCNWSELLDEPRAKNRGISGDRTEGILDRLDEVLDSKPIKVFLMIGINDLGAGKSVNFIKMKYVDLHTGFKTENDYLNPEYSNDGLHLLGTGYLKWKSLIINHIKD